MKNNHNMNDLLLDKNNNESSLSLTKLFFIGVLLSSAVVGIIYYFMSNDKNDSQIIVEPNKKTTSVLEEPDSPFNILKKSTTDKGRDKTLIQDLTKQREKEKNTFLKKIEDTKEKKNTSLKPKDTNKPLDIRSMRNSSLQKPIETKQSVALDNNFVKPNNENIQVPNKTIKRVIQSGYYVQVGAFYNTSPKEEFLRSILSKNYSYEFYAVKINGKQVNKVVIGPFQSKYDARSELSRIKSIEKNAFILKVN